MFRYTKATAVREVIVWVIALLVLLPFYFLIAMALKPDAELLTTSLSAPPSSPTFGNFVDVLSETGQSSILLGLMRSLANRGMLTDRQ